MDGVYRVSQHGRDMWQLFAFNEARNTVTFTNAFDNVSLGRKDHTCDQILQFQEISFPFVL